MDFNALGTIAAKHTNIDRAVDTELTLLYDADFACYEVADLEIDPENNLSHLLDYIEMKRVVAGANDTRAFLTLGAKSGRDAMATVKPYQENRDPDAPIKVRVRELRTLLAQQVGVPRLTVYATDIYEADDLICMHQNHALKNGEKTTIMSGDKDLWMIEGAHCCPKTGRRWTVDGYGYTEYREVGNVKPKLVGEGTSWFWHQMLMGDRADNIPGLESMTNAELDKYSPLKSRKPRKSGSVACGEAKAVMVLNGVTSDKEACAKVAHQYCKTYGDKFIARFMEQGYLLWMQRTSDPYDFQHFLEEIGYNHLKFTKVQKNIIEGFKNAKIHSTD